MNDPSEPRSAVRAGARFLLPFFALLGFVLTVAVGSTRGALRATWSAPVTLSDPAHRSAAGSVALDEHGDAIAIWTGGFTAPSGRGTFVVWAATKRAGRAWTKPINLSSFDQNRYSWQCRS